jgi:DNA invertase Pin-like site-specific DNA recombinase
MNAVIFVRVSSKKQEYERQISDLQQVVKLRDYNLVEIITEKISGAKRTASRPAFQKLLALAKAGAIENVLVTEVTRLGRNTREVVNAIEDLIEVGVNIYIHNYKLDTIVNGKRNPIAQFLTTILAEVGRLEREFMIERTRSGLAQARRDGKKLGRPVGSSKPAAQFLDQNQKAAKLLKKGRSIREVAKLSGISINTTLKVKRALSA